MSAPAACALRWPLLDPNDEDRRNGNAHHCVRQPGHPGGHRCACGERTPERHVLVSHPNGRCYGHLEWTDAGTTLVLDHCECPAGPEVSHPAPGCAVCGATDLPVIGHRCPGGPL